MKKDISDFKSSIQPTANILVSCRDKDGRDNALAVGYCSNCSYAPPMVMVGIVPSRFSYHIIKEQKCFVVNLVTTEQKELFDYLGSHSGRDEDKLKVIGAKLKDADKINAPLLLDCPVNIECTVVDSILTGSHEMFVGKVVAVHADEKYANENSTINFSDMRFL